MVVHNIQYVHVCLFWLNHEVCSTCSITSESSVSICIQGGAEDILTADVSGTVPYTAQVTVHRWCIICQLGSHTFSCSLCVSFALDVQTTALVVSQNVCSLLWIHTAACIHTVCVCVVCVCSLGAPAWQCMYTQAVLYMVSCRSWGGRMFRPQCSRDSCRPCSVLPEADLVVCYPCKSWNETSIVRRNCRVSRMFWGTGNSVTAASSFGFVLRPCGGVITWPRYSTSVRMNLQPLQCVTCRVPLLFTQSMGLHLFSVCVCVRERESGTCVHRRQKEGEGEAEIKRGSVCMIIICYLLLTQIGVQCSDSYREKFYL